MTSSQHNDKLEPRQSQTHQPEPHPRNGHLRIPNKVAEALAQLRMSGSQAQILWVVLRKTLGWQKSGEWKNEPYPISLADLNQATSVSRRWLLQELEDLTRRHILTRQPRKGKASLLSLNLDVVSWGVSKQALVPKSALGSDGISTSTSDEISTNLVMKSALVPDTKSKLGNKPKETLKKHTKETGVETTPPITRTKSKPYQVEAGIFLDLVEEREDTKIINRGKAIKAIRAIFGKYPETTPEELYQCFVWLRDNDSFLHNKEPPAIISFMPDKFPAWLAGKLQGIGGERYGRQPGKGVRPKPKQEKVRPITYIKGSREDEQDGEN